MARASMRIRRRRDGVVQIIRPTRWRPAGIAVAVALGAVPFTLAVLLVLPVLLLEIPPLAATGAIVLLLLFIDRRRAAKALAARRGQLRVVRPLDPVRSERSEA